MQMKEAEIVEDGNLFTSRLEVPGGWIYRSYDKSNHLMGMAFVPNPHLQIITGDE